MMNLWYRSKFEDLVSQWIFCNRSIKTINFAQILIIYRGVYNTLIFRVDSIGHIVFCPPSPEHTSGGGYLIVGVCPPPLPYPIFFSSGVKTYSLEFDQGHIYKGAYSLCCFTWAIVYISYAPTLYTVQCTLLRR